MCVCLFSFRSINWKERCHFGHTGLLCYLNACPFWDEFEEKEIVGVDDCTLLYKSFGRPNFPCRRPHFQQENSANNCLTNDLIWCSRLSETLEWRQCSLEISSNPEGPCFPPQCTSANRHSHSPSLHRGSQARLVTDAVGHMAL